MSQLFAFQSGSLNIVIERADDEEVRLLHFSSLPFTGRSPSTRIQSLIELQTSGENHADHHAKKYTGTLPGTRLRFVALREIPVDGGTRVEIDLDDTATGLFVNYYMQLYAGISMVRVWAAVTNRGGVPVTLTFVSTFALWGLAQDTTGAWADSVRLHLPHHTWCSESQWRTHTVRDLGLAALHEFSLKRIAYASTGTMSTSEYLPMAVLENTSNGCSLCWQIEHNGSWYWEIGDKQRDLYLRLSGPTDRESQWSKQLAPDETFVTVSAGIGDVRGGFERAVQELTRYRRRIRRAAPDQQTLPIVFNDYMNCLMGDPTTEKLMPLIERAGRLGCDIFCIDAGWHGDGYWWDSVGEWQPSQRRFPNGLREVVDAIRAHGMIAGLWLEIEVMGVKAQLAQQLPEECFFRRHGERVIDNGRYQLDFRHPRVVAHANHVIDTLIRDYGIGYFKIDYNIDAGAGTEIDADSPGDGLLEHNRAYLHWLDSVHARYSELIVETCASGGMRMDWAALSRANLQSSSDQMDYRHTARIVSTIAAALPPEQCANWVYPLASDDDEAVIFNLINGMLMRIHLSGQLDKLTPEAVGLIESGLTFYRSIRSLISVALPVFPLGLPAPMCQWLGFGLLTTDRLLLAVWRLDSEAEELHINLSSYGQLHGRLAATFPSDTDIQVDMVKKDAIVRIPNRFSARLLVIE